MTLSKVVSFRQNATGEINELLDEEQLDCKKTLNLLAFLAGALVDLKNEGTPLNPAIIVCESIERFTSQLPAANVLRLGELDFDEHSGKKILKSCAYMAHGSWHVLIERTNSNIVKYGLFSVSQVPGALSIENLITLATSQCIFIIRKTSAATTRILTAKGNSISFAFSTEKDNTGYTDATLTDFFNKINNVESGDIGERYKSYISDLIMKNIESCHGTIILVLRKRITKSFRLLKDCTICNPAIEIKESFFRFARENSTSSLVHLQNIESLVHGIFQGDGMIALDDSGNLVACKIFYKPKTEKKVDGGARRRAFEALAPLVGISLKAALFRSQDGLTLIKSEADEIN